MNALSARYQAKANNVLRLLEEFGMDLGMPHARRIKGRLWKLHPGDNRLFYFLQIERQFVILHSYRKKSMKAPEKEIATALRRKQEFLEK